MATIFDIERDILDVISQLEENEGEITEEIEEVLSINRNELKTKLQQYSYVNKKINSEIELAKFEIKRLQGLVKRKEKAIEKLDEYSEKAIELYGLENSKSKAKKKPKEVDLGLEKAVLSYTEAVEITVEPKSLVDIPEDLQFFTTVEITKSYYYEEAIEQLSKENQDKLPKVTFNINKKELKEELSKEDNRIENAVIKQNSNLKFK